MTTAIVTGASRGLGRALAAALHDRGYRVVVDARDVTRMPATGDRKTELHLAQPLIHLRHLAGQLRWDPARTFPLAPRDSDQCSFDGVRIVARRFQFVQCHVAQGETNLKVGNALGVAMYAYRERPTGR
jgi:NAD(P)-dependent dehydrogenase (short-subunit alcohol dehydrogenase family)